MLTAKAYGKKVEVIDVFEGSFGRKVAICRNLDGSTVTKYTMGGPTQDEEFHVPVDHLSGIHGECTCKPTPDDYYPICPACREYLETREVPY